MGGGGGSYYGEKDRKGIGVEGGRWFGKGWDVLGSGGETEVRTGDSRVSPSLTGRAR